MSRRRTTSGTPRGLDETRVRRGSQQAAAGVVAGSGNTVDATGRIKADLGPEFFSDERGRTRIRVDGQTVAIQPGSAPRLVVMLGDDSLVKTPKGVVARPSADEVRGPKGTDDANVTASLNRLEKAYKAADAAILASIKPFKAGNDALAAGQCQFVPGYALNVGTYALFIQRSTLGGSPGTIYSDPTSWTATKVQIDSTDGADDGGFSWLLVKLT